MRIEPIEPARMRIEQSASFADTLSGGSIRGGGSTGGGEAPAPVVDAAVIHAVHNCGLRARIERA
ncbi:hypothetical protein FEK33_26215 [Nocardia asteroides NBRC 15531]|uniref:Uncharacterized protein n=1 Tax=Nocardia asteroides NBRC 15531 TaxID=1110697 RepID=U5ELP5_NOCAS|nr:hypothetical protein [Nocardia asteroides]TLF63505.1 hypothetical protein FEK33_26215 [Nocardia asteroides NBRC 15531]UGT47048.1 hypothetical protein LT345_21300 [Nocardia asteroides]GAD87238.1 hypothetical protein NCAST_34_03680 [Nocardia asteroides NBRC 15531]